MSMQTNIFAGTCVHCKKRVEPGSGRVSGKVGKDWRVVHEGCIPAVVGKLPEGLEYDL